MANSVANKPRKTTPLGGHWSDKMIADDKDGYQLVQQHRTELESALRKIKKSAKSSGVDASSEVKKLRQNAEKKLQDAMLAYTTVRDNGDTASSSSGRDKSVQKQVEEGVAAALKPYTGMLSAMAQQQQQQQVPPRTPLALEDADRVMKRARTEAATVLADAPTAKVLKKAAELVVKQMAAGELSMDVEKKLQAAVVAAMPGADAAKLYMQHFRSTGKMPLAIAKRAAEMYADQCEQDETNLARRQQEYMNNCASVGSPVDARHPVFKAELRNVLYKRCYNDIKAEIREELEQEGSQSRDDGNDNSDVPDDEDEDEDEDDISIESDEDS